MRESPGVPEASLDGDPGSSAITAARRGARSGLASLLLTVAGSAIAVANWVVAGAPGVDLVRYDTSSMKVLDGGRFEFWSEIRYGAPRPVYADKPTPVFTMKRQRLRLDCAERQVTTLYATYFDANELALLTENTPYATAAPIAPDSPAARYEAKLCPRP
jgi:hypothetical protein